MSLRDMMTATASTERLPGMTSGKKSTTQSANLTNVLITPPMLPNQRNLSAMGIVPFKGMEGTAIQYWEAYTESHTHTDSGASVTQMPDIQIGDRLTCNGIEYTVDWTQIESDTLGFGNTLVILLTRDVRA